MAFAFKQQGGIDKQVREIASEQITKALAQCAAPDADFDQLVHRLRRRCKKLRGLVRLIAPRFKHAKRENGAFRDAAAGLSGRRDATVMIETFAALLGFDRASQGKITAAQAESLSGALTFRAGARLAKWQLSGHGFDQIGDGLEDTYRRMRSGLALAATERTAEALHDWRKHTKYHGHHVCLLHAAAPDILGPCMAGLDRLGELLGDHHNLAVLDNALAAQEPKDDVAAVRSVIAARQALLASGAFDLGRQLVAEKPAMLRERFEQYWSLLPEKN